MPRSADESGDGPGNRWVGGSQDFTQQVVSLIRSRGCGSVWAIANAVGCSHAYCDQVVKNLVAKARLKELVIQCRRFYVVPTQPFLDCRCDGRCKEQIVVLSNPHYRRLYRHLDLNGPMRFHELVSQSDQDMGWSQRTLQRRLGRLLDVGLSCKRSDPSDLRSAVYACVEPVDAASTVLQETSWTD